MKLGYTIIYVNSVENTLGFYERAFGLEIKFSHESGSYGELETGSTVLAFASYEMGDMNFDGQYVKIRPEEKPIGVELAFVTEDVEEAYQKAITAGAIPIKKPVVKPWGQRVGYVRDINGFLIELCSPMPG